MSVLQDMTKGIMQTKATKASKLTPVAGESERTVEQAAMTVAEQFAPFPFDSLGQTLLQVSARLRLEAKALVESAEHLEAVANVGPDHPQGKVPAAEPINAQRKFEADLAEKQAKAQAEVFTAADADGDPETDGWVCPTHGAANVKSLKTRAGLAYSACTKCDAFSTPQ